MQSVNEMFGIPDSDAKKIVKEYSQRIKPLFEAGNLSESESLRIIETIPISDRERLWLAYHIGGINRMLLYAKENSKQIIINW